MIKKCFIAVLLLSGTGTEVFSQVKPKYKKTVRAEFQLPRATSNSAFKKAFSGVYNTGLSLNVGTPHYSGGVFYSITQYQVFPKVNTDAHPILTVHTTGLKLTYDKLITNGRGMWSPYVAPGVSFLNYSRVKCKVNEPTLTHTTTFSLNAGINYNIMMDDWVGAGFIVGYNVVDHVYRPENICMDEWGLTYTEGEKQGILQNVYFGFSVYFDLAYKPETSE
jgi:hypothetical protein